MRSADRAWIFDLFLLAVFLGFLIGGLTLEQFRTWLLPVAASGLGVLIEAGRLVRRFTGFRLPWEPPRQRTARLQHAPTEDPPVVVRSVDGVDPATSAVQGASSPTDVEPSADDAGSATDDLSWRYTGGAVLATIAYIASLGRVPLVASTSVFVFVLVTLIGGHRWRTGILSAVAMAGCVYGLQLLIV